MKKRAIKMKTRKSIVRRGSGMKKEQRQAIGVLFLIIVILALFALVTLYPQRSPVVQTGALISDEETEDEEAASSPMTVLRVIYTKE